MVKNIKIKKVKYFWLYIVLGALGVITSIILAPIWNFWEQCPWKTWGQSILGIIIAAAILFYVGYYLIKKIIRSRGVIQVLYIIECVVLVLIAIGSILIQLQILPIKEICMIIGLIFWSEGVIDLFRAYFHQRDSKTSYPMWRLCIAIGAVTLGTYMFAKPFFQNIVVLWVFVSLLFVLSIALIVFGAMCKPAGKPKKVKENKKNSDNKKAIEEKEEKKEQKIIEPKITEFKPKETKSSSKKDEKEEEKKDK